MTARTISEAQPLPASSASIYTPTIASPIPSCQWPLVFCTHEFRQVSADSHSPLSSYPERWIRHPGADYWKLPIQTPRNTPGRALWTEEHLWKEQWFVPLPLYALSPMFMAIISKIPEEPHRPHLLIRAVLCVYLDKFLSHPHVRRNSWATLTLSLRSWITPDQHIMISSRASNTLSPRPSFLGLFSFGVNSPHYHPLFGFIGFGLRCVEATSPLSIRVSTKSPSFVHVRVDLYISLLLTSIENIS